MRHGHRQPETALALCSLQQALGHGCGKPGFGDLKKNDHNALGHGHPQPAGFTLLEVMVALLLMALMAILSWRALDSMVRTREILAQHDQQFDAARILFGQWDQDCRELGQPDQWLAGVPVNFAPHRVDLIRLRKQPNGAALWVFVSYRWNNGTIERLESPPQQTRQMLLQNWANLQQGQELDALLPVTVVPLMGQAADLMAQARMTGADWSADTQQLNTQWRLPNLRGNALLLGLDLVVPLSDADALPLHKICLTGQNG